jgi:hypothetical protein
VTSTDWPRDFARRGCQTDGALLSRRFSNHLTEGGLTCREARERERELGPVRVRVLGQGPARGPAPGLVQGPEPEPVPARAQGPARAPVRERERERERGPGQVPEPGWHQPGPLQTRPWQGWSPA